MDIFNFIPDKNVLVKQKFESELKQVSDEIKQAKTHLKKAAKIKERIVTHLTLHLLSLIKDDSECLSFMLKECSYTAFNKKPVSKRLIDAFVFSATHCSKGEWQGFNKDEHNRFVRSESTRSKTTNHGSRENVIKLHTLLKRLNEKFAGIAELHYSTNVNETLTSIEFVFIDK